MTAALWVSGDAAAATGGKAIADWSVSGISIDTRTLEPGDLFVALAGPNFDGHDFVDAARACDDLVDLRGDCSQNAKNKILDGVSEFCDRRNDVFFCDGVERCSKPPRAFVDEAESNLNLVVFRQLPVKGVGSLLRCKGKLAGTNPDLLQNVVGDFAACQLLQQLRPRQARNKRQRARSLCDLRGKVFAYPGRLQFDQRAEGLLF